MIPKDEGEVGITVRVSMKDLEDLRDLKKKGYFMSVSDAVRTAIRNLIREYKQNQSVTSSQVVENKKEVEVER